MPTDYSFASNLFKSIEHYFIKCYMPKIGSNNRPELEKQILASKGVVFAVSVKASTSPDWVSLLEFAKQQKKKVKPTNHPSISDVGYIDVLIS